MAKRKSNWDIIRKQKATDTAKFRDVYNEQQLERGSLQKPETMTSRNIICIVLALFAFIIVWLAVSVVNMLFSNPDELKVNQAPDNLWIHVSGYYQNKDDPNDRITPEEYDKMVKAFDGKKIDVVTKPVEVSESDNPAKIWTKDGDHYKDRLVESKQISAEEYDKLVKEYAERKEKYESDLAAYNDYLRESTSPKDTYKKQVPHYRYRSDFSRYIKEDEYDKQLTAYQEKVVEGKIKDKEKNIPYQPIDPRTVYKAYDESRSVIKSLESLKLDEWLHVLDIEDDGKFGKDDKANLLATYGDVSFRSVLDGHTISASEFLTLLKQYSAEIAVFRTDYDAYMKEYYPDYVPGKKVLNLGPNKVKVFASLGVALFLYGILYLVFKKNLDAANSLSDTSDINQYHNDQHIAMPQEIQEKYDWFPDVGAHSAVQVSSMISHMALENKGLKKITMAKRAEKDIVNADGAIEYYKGEIIMDDNDNPIVSTVPMIDEDFAEDLFEASGTPRDKDIRKRYDATKINYNGDGHDRDKLGKYETVADLINADWEFPMYEPQRPGGAYIIDTAPVNTMVYK